MMATTRDSDVLSRINSEEIINTDNLKRTCEECTKSKVKCSGPDKGICERCDSRGSACVFRTKLKRGPQPHSKQQQSGKKTKDQSENDDDVDDEVVPSTIVSTLDQSKESSGANPGSMSWHERRCWNVFFATFKHQNQKENPIAWCWFALQLEKLRKDLKKMNNTAALDRLEEWMMRLETKTSTVERQTVKQCVFAPHLCAGCSAAALVKDAEGAKKYKRHADLTGAASAFFQRHGKPFVEFEMDRDGARLIEVNELFTTVFGHTKESLGSTMMWSGGGGFLPWGGDLLSRLLWSEADVLIFLQVLAVKFQALGPPQHDHGDPTHVMTRDVLSAYIFDVRVSSDAKTTVSDEMVVPCMVKSLHRETLQGTRLKITVVLEFDILGPPRPGPDSPESCKEAMAALQRFENLEFSEAQASSAPTDVEHNSNPNAPLVIPTPQEDMALLDPEWNWQTFESTVAEDKTTIPQQLQPVPRSSSFNDGLAQDMTDEAWLGLLLDWTS